MINDDRTTTLGVLSIFNEKDKNAMDGSPPEHRRRAHHILDDQRSVNSKRDSGIGEGLMQLGPAQSEINSRQNMKVGSARIKNGGKTTDANNAANSKRRLGTLNQGKRSYTKPL